MEFIVPPLLWWMALPALLLGAYALAQTGRAPDALPFSSAALLKRALAGRPSTAMRRHAPPVLAALAMATAAVALARPAVRTPLPREAATIVLVLDTSGSMGQGDMFPNRLAAAKRASRRFVETLPSGFQVGVVEFSDTASLVQPVTDDHQAVHAAIESLELAGGTHIGDGMQVALASLPSELLDPAARPAQLPGAPPPPPPAVILLLTDGQNGGGSPPMDVAQQARAANVPVFTIGMGGSGGPFGGGRGGGVDEEALREIAATTGGQYYFAPGGGELAQVYRDLGLALGWDFVRSEIGGYVATGGLVAAVMALAVGYLWLHRDL
ncbi:MAG TPA: VWA domain-containing protein [Chloroflexota bacterium]|nr:VWA domain-containing protein [Chloroflexota bacterium]